MFLKSLRRNGLRSGRLVQNWSSNGPLRAQSDMPGNMGQLERLIKYKPQLTKKSNNWYGGIHNEDYDDEDEDWDEDGEFEEEEELNPLFRVGKQLLKMSRVKYRHMESMPDWVQEKADIITSHRTGPQIRRCLKNWMIKPDREQYAKYRTKRLMWREKEKERNGPNNSQPLDLPAYGPNETVAYTHYFMPSKFGISRRVFRELSMLAPSFQPQNMLDFGCGPGTAGAAAVEVWGEESKSDSNSTSTDKGKKGFGKGQYDRHSHRDKYVNMLHVCMFTAVLLLSYPASSGALENPGRLLSYPTIYSFTSIKHNTNILIHYPP